ncbi:MAG: FAD-binding domain-containing protein, partial [Myxococcota bacterium]
EPDAITQEVGQIIQEHFSDHPGALNLGNLPATSADAAAVWRWALEYALPQFGPYEDAMSKAHRSLFHTQLAPLLNLHRVLASTVIKDAEHAELPMNCKEGFIRQILGWREFVRHVHTATDGFRTLDGVATASTPDAGAAPSVLGAAHPLPAAWWDAPSGLACLDTVVAEVWEHGWTHHIPRLMVLSNLATLLDISPRELTDWFWVAFVDAFDWVVEPNVLSMGTFGTGPVMTTKPYVSGANYLNKMGDYCGSCAFHPKKTCPVTPLYWAFLARHQEALSTNQRMSLALGGLKRRSPERRQQDARTLEIVRGAMDAGDVLTPERLQAELSRSE